MTNEERYREALIVLSGNFHPMELRDMSSQSCYAIGKYIIAILDGKSLEVAAREAQS